MEKVRTIGAFELSDKIGEGDVGTYYLGQHLASEDYSIIEELYEKYARDDNFEKRYKREVAASKILEHENILKVKEFGRTEHSMYVATEYPGGLRLNELLEKSQKLPIDVACSIIRQVLEGLKLVHSKGIVHRNLKPLFLLIGSDGTIKIADFGLALGEELGPIFISKKQLGIAYYLSSELGSGKKVDHRSDIFSLGIIFYEMLCGFNPFKADDFTTIVRNVQRLEPKPLKDVNNEITGEVSSIVEKMLQKDRNQRYMNVSSVINDLDSAAKSQGISLDKKIIADFIVKFTDSKTPTPPVTESKPVVSPPPPSQPSPAAKSEEDMIDFGDEETVPTQTAPPQDDLFDIDLDADSTPPPPPPKKEEPKQEDAFPDLFSGDNPSQPTTEGPKPMQEPGPSELSFAGLNDDLPANVKEEAPPSKPEPFKKELKKPEPAKVEPKFEEPKKEISPPPPPKPEQKKKPPKKDEGPFMTPQIENALFGPAPVIPKSIQKKISAPAPTNEAPPQAAQNTGLSIKIIILSASVALLIAVNILIFSLVGQNKYATLWVETEPADAMILLNGIVQEKESPSRINNIQPGDHIFELRKKGIPDYKTEVKLEGGKEYRIKIDLKTLQQKKKVVKPATTPPKVATSATPQIMAKPLPIITNPAGAQVYVDNAPIGGKTPLNVETTAEKHIITIKLNGYQDHTTQIDFANLNFSNLEIALVANKIVQAPQQKNTDAIQLNKPIQINTPEPESTQTTEATTPSPDQKPLESAAIPQISTIATGTEQGGVRIANFDTGTKIVQSATSKEMSYLDIKASYWGEIWIDDEYQGVTPLVKPLQLEHGEHVVKIVLTGAEKEEFLNLEEKFYFKKGESIIINENNFKKK